MRIIESSVSMAGVAAEKRAEMNPVWMRLGRLRRDRALILAVIPGLARLPASTSAARVNENWMNA
jgi:hypothetical protein